MKQTLLAFLLLILSLSAYSQKIIAESPKVMGDYEGYNVFTYDSNFLIAKFDHKIGKIKLDKYGPNLEIKGSNTLNYKDKHADNNFRNIIELNGKLFLLTALDDTDNKAHTMFIQEFNGTTYQAVGSRIELLSYTYTKVQKNIGSGLISYRISPDKSKILVFCNSEICSFKAYNAKLELLHGNELEGNIAIKDAVIDNDGVVYLFENEYLENKRNYYFHLPEYIKGYTINAYDKNMHNVFVVPTTKGFDFVKSELQVTDKAIVFMGFRGDNDHLKVLGFHYFNLSKKTLTENSAMQNNFEEEYVLRHLTEKQQKPYNKLAKKHGKFAFIGRVDKCEIRYDERTNILYLIGEIYEITSEAGSNNTWKEYNNYNEILIIGINVNTHEVNSEKIVKNQVPRLSWEKWMSFGSFIDKSGLNIVVNIRSEVVNEGYGQKFADSKDYWKGSFFRFAFSPKLTKIELLDPENMSPLALTTSISDGRVLVANINVEKKNKQHNFVLFKLE